MEKPVKGAASSASYDCRDIQVLSFTEAIRMRPGMYVGDCADGSGLHALVWGLVEDALGDASRRPFRVAVTIHAAGAVTVEDDGPGLPALTSRGAPLLEELFTSGRCRRCNHPAACALSERLFAEVRHGGQARAQEFARGVPIAPERDLGPTPGTGTRVTLRPDPIVFGATAIDARRLAAQLRELSFLNAGLRVDFADERRPTQRFSMQTRGLGELVNRMREGQQGVPVQVIEARGNAHGVGVDAAFAWVWSSGERLLSFVNGQRTHHGPHEDGLVWGIARALIERAAPSGVRPKVDPARIRRGLVGAVAITHPNPSFDACRRTIFDEDAKLATRDVVERAMRSPLFDPALLEALFARLRD